MVEIQNEVKHVSKHHYPVKTTSKNKMKFHPGNSSKRSGTHHADLGLYHHSQKGDLKSFHNSNEDFINNEIRNNNHLVCKRTLNQLG